MHVRYVQAAEGEEVKLFIWEGEGVLQDYTSGMIVAIGIGLQDELLAVEKKCPYCMNSFPAHKPSQVIELGDASASPGAWNCYGGG